MMKTAKTETRIPELDPLALCAGLAELKNGDSLIVPEALRAYLGRFEPAQLPLLGAVPFYTLLHFGGGRIEWGRADWLAARAMEVLRATHTPGMIGGFGDDLSALYVHDPKLRARWESLEARLMLQTEEGGGGRSTILGLMEILSAAGDLRATLQRRRDELDQAIASLDRTMAVSGEEVRR